MNGTNCEGLGYLEQLRRTTSTRSSHNAASRLLDHASSTVRHPPKPRHIGQTVHTRGPAYATRYALQPFAAHRCKGRGLGIESTAALLLPSPQWSEQGILLFYG